MEKPVHRLDAFCLQPTFLPSINKNHCTATWEIERKLLAIDSMRKFLPAFLSVLKRFLCSLMFKDGWEGKKYFMQKFCSKEF